MIQARSNNNQKVRMPVTEQNSTVKIAFLMKKKTYFLMHWECFNLSRVIKLILN